jgi:PAS domain S-box-containing protein
MTPEASDLLQLEGEELIQAIQTAAASADAATASLLHVCAEVLRREMDKSQRFLDMVGTIIVGLDPEGCVTLINRKGCELLGYAEKDLMGRCWFSSCLPEDSETVHKVFLRIMGGELQALDYYENEVLTRTGDRRMVAWHNNYLRDAEGVIVGTLSSGEDITARKRAEERNVQLLAENRRLTWRLFAVQEMERRRLSRELHDELGQWLSAVQAHAQLIAALAGTDLPDIRESADEIKESIETAMRNVRRMIRDLRPAVLDALGLEESLRELVSRWGANHPAISCDLALDGGLGALDEALSITVYRIVQEALTNVVSHADASEVRIELYRSPGAGPEDDVLSVTVVDDGKGIIPGARSEGMGLLGMRERVLTAGGTFDLESSPGRGVRIRVKLPVGVPGGRS